MATLLAPCPPYHVAGAHLAVHGEQLWPVRGVHRDGAQQGRVLLRRGALPLHHAVQVSTSVYYHYNALPPPCVQAGQPPGAHGHGDLQHPGPGEL